MSEGLSYCNKWLRSQADLPRKHRSTLIYCGLQPPEQQLVLDSVKLFEERMNSGKVQIAVTLRHDKHDGTIDLFVEGSKEMST